jgi:sugar/nucleoside kinase (ribokinase family)
VTVDLLVVGDANPDLILRGGDVEPAFGQREQIVDEAALVLGGSGSIMACGAARLGLQVGIVACVGDDTLGRFTREELEASGVDTAAVQVLLGATGVTVALARDDDRAMLTARGALAGLDPAAVPDELLSCARHVHVASPFLQPRLRDGLPQLIARARAASATLSLDPGWDPEERWSITAGRVDVLMPNAQEAAALSAAAGRASVAASGNTQPGDRRSEGVSGGGADARPAVPPPATAGADLAALGPLVVVKHGAAGAVAFAGGEVVRVAAPVVDVVDATGAGDSFDAGFLAAWLEGASLERALALGCACGALSTRALGGTAGQPDRAEAEALALRVGA